MALSVRLDVTCVFRPFNCRQGMKDKARVKDVKNRCTRFLNGDYFTLRLELRIKCPENERWRLSFEGGEAVCEVASPLLLFLRKVLCGPQWKLRHLREMSPSTLTTDVFDTGGCRL